MRNFFFIKVIGIKKKENRATHWILFLVFLFFIVWGFIAIFNAHEYIFDRFFSAALVLLLFGFYKIMKLRFGVTLFALFALVLHHLKLYGNFYLGMPFDRIMHFTAGIALGLIAYDYLRQRTDMKRIEIAIIAVLIAMGAGAIMEIIEFVGYSVFGEGEGLLFFGKGDFGEWFNASWDMLNNMFGAIGGVIFGYLVFKKK